MVATTKQAKYRNGISVSGDSSAYNLAVAGVLDMVGTAAKFKLPSSNDVAGEDRMIRLNPTTGIPEYFYSGTWRNFNAQTNVAWSSDHFQASDGTAQRHILHIDANGRTNAAKSVMKSNGTSFSDCGLQVEDVAGSGVHYNNISHTISLCVQGRQVISGTTHALQFHQNAQGANLVLSGSLSGYSDPRTKDILGKVGDASEVARLLEVVMYKSKVDGSVQVGYDASQVEKVCPMLLGPKTEEVTLLDGSIIKDVNTVAYDRAGVLALQVAGDNARKLDIIAKHLGVNLYGDSD